MTTDLSVSVDGTDVGVESTGDRVLVDVPALGAAVDVLRSVPRERLTGFSAALRAADVTVEVRVRESPVAILGADARAGPVSRRLGVAPAEFRVGGALVAVARGAGASVAEARRLLDALAS
ncbi:hypothetical protein [Halobacterium litoreum]|uniref:hypothetical protein n=1 Tax=Halobacterium litoreum TaxID=2039234 RepID=UPI001E51B5C3|nr:hypothetical protein [Halobacterium litoreum]UHH14520.1 hypothetical protein LT972_05855 [Halobacterium litoreum]